MTADEFTAAALSLPHAEQSAHFGKTDFRVAGKIFAGFADHETGYVKLAAEQQEMLCGAEPEIFVPIPGGWGRKGWTHVILARCDRAALESALAMAWRNVAPKRLASVIEGR